MKFTQLGILVILLCIPSIICRKKKTSKSKKSSFSFDSLLSGMNGNEKAMFKEELEKEVKKFNIPTHHKVKSSTVTAAKKRSHKTMPRISRKPVTPGICDPICEHQCVNGCDFRCCIPRYQVTHNIPRPLPHITLPGSCSPTCSPTCFPECSPACCGGGISGMFQSSVNIPFIYRSPPRICPPSCPASCSPHCEETCCNPSPEFSPYTNNFNMYSALPPLPPRLPPRLPSPIPPKRPYRPLSPSLEELPPLSTPLSSMILNEPAMEAPVIQPTQFTHCGGACPMSCAPTCLSSCCMESQQIIPAPMPPASIPMFNPQPQPIAMQPLLPPSCPGICSAACAPACSASCCNEITNPAPQVSEQQNEAAIARNIASAAQHVLPPVSQPLVASVAQPAILPVVQPAAPVVQPAASLNVSPVADSTLNARTISQNRAACSPSCPDICLPDCSDSCCSTGPPHTEIDKKSKISKIAAQLAMLRKKH